MTGFRALPSLAVLGLVLASTSVSHAYCRTHTCDSKKESCDYSNGCNLGGFALFWPTRTITYSINKADSANAGISRETLGSVVGNAFTRWVSADCQGGTPSFVMRRLPQDDDGVPQYVECAKPEYNNPQGNANVITFHDEKWPYENTGAETLALTTVFFNPKTGEIYDANIEVNTSEPERNRFVVGSPRAGDIDLNAVLTHETGHFLGLSHSAQQGSTMWSSYDPGMDTLELDDMAGICDALPPGRVPQSDSTEPRHGFDTNCASETGCCQSAVGSKAPSSTGLWVFGLGLAAWLGRARLKRSRPARAPALRR